MTFDSITPHRPTTLQDAIINIDKDILRLLARRTNMLQKICAHGQAHVDAQTEKILRTAWEKYAARMSNDARVTQQLFALLQEIEFLPKPKDGEARRPAFNLAPMRKAVDVRLTAPLGSRSSRLFLTLAAVSGSACSVNPSMLGDADVECVKMFNQLGTSLAWKDNGSLFARQGGGLTLADKVVFVGSDPLNFFLVLGQYVGHPSHARFNGESPLKMYNLTSLRHFLPQLGVRLTNVVPKTDGLPVRIECSGMLPDAFSIPEDIPADAVVGLLLGMPFWPKAASMDVHRHPQAAAIIAECGTILRQCGANLRVDGMVLHVTPSDLTTPTEPPLDMELSLAAYLLALPAAAGGMVRLDGRFPQDDAARQVRGLLQAAGIQVEDGNGCMTTSVQDELPAYTLPAALDATTLPAPYTPLAVVLTAISALRTGSAPMPRLPEGATGDARSFLQQAGLECGDDGRVTLLPEHRPDDLGWTAPSAFWALGMALLAYARSGLKLANPATVTALYPSFWSFYNALPCPEIKQQMAETAHEKPVRRRIIAANPDGLGSGDSNA